MIDRLNVGGPTHHVTLISRGLESRGFKTLLLKGQVAPGEAEMTEVISRSGVKPVEIEGLGRVVSPLQFLTAFLQLYRCFREFRPQVVHTHKTVAGGLARPAARLAGVPIVVHTFHGNIFSGYYSNWKSKMIVLAERLLSLTTDVVVAVTSQQRRELLGFKITSPARLRNIPLGLDLHPFVQRNHRDDGFRAELGFSEHTPLAGMVTRLVPIKGIPVFLEAAQRVLEMLPNARFVIVGDGESRQELDLLTKKMGLSEFVRFTGFRSDTERVYSALDLVVLSSFNEGLSVTLIEAIAAGCYVVATRVGGVPDLVEHDGVGKVVEPGDSNALAQAMAQVLKDPRRVPEASRENVQALYGISRLVEDLDQLYQKLLDNKQSRQSEISVRAVCWEGKDA